jgi:hypothetical protein
VASRRADPGATRGPVPRSGADPFQQKDPADQEEREQEEPGEERSAAVVDHVDHLNLLPVGLGGVHLLDTLRDAVALACAIGADTDADPREEHEQQCHYSDPSTHLETSLSCVLLRE